VAEDETDALLAVAERLYAGPAEEFTEARNAAAKGVDRLLATEIKKLKKPSVAAWAVNLLVRSETEQIDSVLELAASLRAAAEALDGDELRALTRQRRQLTSALATAARSHARDAGVRLTGPVVDQVEGMLTAAMLDPVAAQVVRTGRVVTAFTATGVSDLDVAAVVAVPDPVLTERACAVVVPRPGAEVTLGSIGAFLLDQGLARQKCPERLEVVAELPRTPTGKVQKFVLRAALVRDDAI